MVRGALVLGPVGFRFPEEPGICLFLNLLFGIDDQSGFLVRRYCGNRGEPGALGGRADRWMRRACGQNKGQAKM